MSHQELITNGIKQVRLHHKLTQEQFAERINMSVQGYRNIEYNKYLPSASTIDKICEVFDITPAELLIPKHNKNLDEIFNIIKLKLRNCPLEKLIRINQMIDLM